MCGHIGLTEGLKSLTPWPRISQFTIQARNIMEIITMHFSQIYMEEEKKIF